MKKKILTLVLTVVLCLSAITPVTAADTLNRVASTIPGTDIEYNYVENITIKIPGTEVSFDFEGVADFLLFNKEYSYNSMEKDPNSGEWVSVHYSYDIPVYHFSVFEQFGRVTINQDGEWLVYRGCAMIGDGHTELLTKGQVLQSSSVKMTRDVGADVYDEYSTIVDANGACCVPFPIDSIDSPIAMIEIQIVDHSYFEKEGFDKDEFDVNYHYGFNNWEETIDISEFAIIEETLYSIIEGANSVINSEENSLITRADGDFNKFTGVKVDSELIDSNNYTATEGSTIINFKPDYLKVLDVGMHTVSVMFTDGEATTNFEIKEDLNYALTIQTPSRTEIRNKDGIILHANVEGTAPTDSYVVWTSSNGNFDEDIDGNNLTVIAESKGYTTFTATLYDADGNELARDTVEMYSKSGFFDKIGGFFRSLFGSTKIYEY